ncbi:16S rRNA (guanine(527)-N(7))-methyltransferase RsmG [Pinibacter aurantiacus]|uniref:Ribosomal RNA small subunit methyltransferase G n=1 Tax=Pinibacter aurantiacus TaxID=2851599 RepID=A0A9E2S710_9BACT|nr:16S rRNA (guanine(527)-N(7))-methyltransferase RsmG [Pinibacter aurantiacus]MBV4356981.1 16S rRNA (guanine(527)-N(7))-methyltransferase RsmG [Pinibacter aurantiacus]
MELVLKYFSDFTPQQLQQLEGLGELYKEWNEKINVISRKNIESLYEQHVLHSLSIAAVFDFPKGYEVVDLGTGGGFPGIPLAIFFPEVQFHLVDSINKKLKVVEAVAEGIGLKNVTVQHTRVEEIKNRKFDCVVSRAVAPLRDLWQWGKPLMKKNKAAVAGENDSIRASGLICLKGGDLAQEVHESGLRPHIVPIDDIFEEEFFKEKFIVNVPH